jgi:hypothetical protein
MLFSTKTRDWLKLSISAKTHMKPLLSVKSLVFTIFPRNPDVALQRQGYVLSCFMKLPGSVEHAIFNTMEEIPLCFKKSGILDLFCTIDISDLAPIYSNPCWSVQFLKDRLEYWKEQRDFYNVPEEKIVRILFFGKEKFMVKEDYIKERQSSEWLQTFFLL